jgi:mono/diheme cytochrome c family protein
MLSLDNRTRLAFFALAALPLTLLVLGGASPVPKSPAIETRLRLERGEHLVRLGGCAECHTPKRMTAQGPVPDLTRFLSGHPASARLTPAPAPSSETGPWTTTTTEQTAWSGPWGVSYASNLTPDTHSGLGMWTEEMFVKAMRTGKHYGFSRALLPPMPWQRLAKLSDSDLKAVFAYLRSLPPVRNHVPDPVPAGTPQLD